MIQIFSQRIDKNLLFFIFLILISFVLTFLINQNLNGNYKNMIFLYLVQPLAVITFMRGKTINVSALNGLFVLQLISWTSVPLLAGCLYFYGVHLMGFPDPYEVFYVELTWAASEIVLRNPSFMGLSLILSGVALIQFLASQYLYLIVGKNFYRFASMFALLSVLLSLSRRAILPILIYYFIISILYPKRHGIKLFVFGSFVILLSILFVPDIFLVLWVRITSIFDVVNDSSNISRLTLMFEGLTDVILRPWGLGFGTLSSVGYTQEEVWTLEEARVTESAIITLFGEIGLVVMLILSVLFIKYLSNIKYPTVLLFILPLIVESIVGLGLLAPVVSFFTISFICAIYYVEINIYKKNSTNDMQLKEMNGYEINK